MTPHYQQQLYLRPSFITFFNFSHKRPTFAFTDESEYTLGSLRKIAHNGLHGETGVFRTGVVSLPSACFACCRNAGRPLVKMVYLPFSGVAEHHSLRGHFFC